MKTITFIEEDEVKREQPESARSSKKSQVSRPLSTSKPGYVYLIRASNGLFKIGKAKDVECRLKVLSNTCACKLELVCTTYSNWPYTLEANLHNQYAQMHSHSEWFALTNDDVEEIKDIMA